MAIEDRKDAIARFLAHGTPVAEVAEKFDLTPSAIYSYLKDPAFLSAKATHEAQLEDYKIIYGYNRQRNALVGQQVLLETMLEGSPEHKLRAASKSVEVEQQSQKVEGERDLGGTHISDEMAKALNEGAKALTAALSTYTRRDITQSPHLIDGADAVKVVQIPDAASRDSTG